MILYFSATGNSKYVAERIANATGDKALSIDEYIDSEKISGIVCPTYAWGVPSVVREFFEKNKFCKADYCFFVATYGTTPGNCGYYAKKYSGIDFDGYFSIKMPDTWTVWFDLSDKEKVAEQNRKADREIDEIITRILAKTKTKRMKRQAPLFTAFAYKISYDDMRKTSNLYVEESCIGCGLCADKCPTKAIEIKNGKPVWIKDKCAICLGCLHRCPKFAIQYGKNTKKHGQYRHEEYGKTDC